MVAIIPNEIINFGNLKNCMNKIIYFISASLFLILFSSCSEEVVSKSDGKQTAIVYSVLNASESIHYVKINRAIFGGGNSINIAQIPDSSYFKNVDAKVEEYVGGTLTRTWILKDTMIENKEEGAFYYPLQKVYYFQTTSTEPLLADNQTTYKLDANINNGEFHVIGETKLVSGMSIGSPKPESFFTFAKSDVPKFGYASTNIGFGTGNAAKLEINLTIEFDEYIDNTLFANKSFVWTVGEYEGASILGPSMSMTTSADGKTFYDLIALNVTKNNLINKRQLKKITISEYGASEDLQKYLLVNKPTSSLTQNKALYTNLTVTNENRVLGIFSSRGSAQRVKVNWLHITGSTYYTALDKNSVKELCLGTITGPYSFCDDHPNYTAEQYFCK